MGIRRQHRFSGPRKAENLAKSNFSQGAVSGPLVDFNSDFINGPEGSNDPLKTEGPDD